MGWPVLLRLGWLCLFLLLGGCNAARQPTATPAPVYHQLGELVTAGGWQVRILSPALQSRNLFTLHVDITNVSSTQQILHMSAFTLAADQTTYPAASVTTVLLTPPGPLALGSYPPGARSSGLIGFLLPAMPPAQVSLSFAGAIWQIAVPASGAYYLYPQPRTCTLERPSCMHQGCPLPLLFLAPCCNTSCTQGAAFSNTTAPQERLP